MSKNVKNIAEELINAVELRTNAIRTYIGQNYVTDMIREQNQNLYDTYVVPHDKQLISVAEKIKLEIYHYAWKYNKVSEVFQDEDIMKFYNQALTMVKVEQKQNHIDFQEKPLLK